jgi:hypothetical protein
VYARKIVLTSRNFFSWLTRHHREYNNISATWIDSLKPRRSKKPPPNSKAVALNDVIAISNDPAFHA